jgi:hypothetical protein
MPRSVEAGVGSMLCVPMYVDEEVMGMLSLYGDRPEPSANERNPLLACSQCCSRLRSLRRGICPGWNGRCRTAI